MKYKNFQISIEKNGTFSAFNFIKLQRAGPQPTIKKLHEEIDKITEKNPP